MDQVLIDVELAVKLTGIKKTELIARLQGENGEAKEDAGKILYQAVLDKFKQQEEELTSKASDSFAQGVAKQSKAVEKALRGVFEKLEIEATSDQIIDGLRELSDKFPETAEPGQPDPQTLTAEAIRKLPAYRDLLKEEQAERDQIKADWEQKYTNLEQQHRVEKVVSVAREKAMSTLDGKNAVWGPDKARQMEFFFKAVGTDQLDLQDGNLILKDKDGAPLRDEARNLVSFDNWILDNWKNAGYTFHEAPPGSGSAGASRQSSEAGGSSKIAITSPQHYEDLLNAAGNDFGKRAEITEAYAEFQMNKKE